MGCLNVNRAAKIHAGWQNLAKDTNNSKKKVRKYVAFLTGGEDFAQCKSTYEEHAGSDKNFENITPCVDQLSLKIQFAEDKKTLKTVVLSREGNTLPNVNRAAKNKLVLTKIWA